MFADLRTLFFFADWDAITLMAESGLPATCKLTMHVTDHCGAARLSAVAALGRLHLLHLHLHKCSVLAASDVMPALLRLSQLRDLCVSSWLGSFRIDSLRDAEFELIVSAMPLLEVLPLEADCDTTPPAIRIAGECCRRLRSLSLHQHHDFDVLPSVAASATKLFPELTRLCLTSPRLN